MRPRWSAGLATGLAAGLAASLASMLALLAAPELAAAADAPTAATPAASGVVAHLPPQVSFVRSVEGISEYALPNGLHVLMLPDPTKPSTFVDMTVRVGSRNESYGETGMAHLLEHMMFKGTTHHPYSIQGELSQHGLDANANTYYDRTTYFAHMAANPANLDWYLRWLADSLVNSTILRRDLDSEMTVVRNEMESGENSPDRILDQEVMSVAYDWHNYGKSTIGARSDVENVNIAHLQAFYHKYYQPDNAVVVITGRFDPDKTLAIVANSFGKIPKPTRVIEPDYTLDPVQQGERSVTLRRVGDTPEILVGYHIPAGSDPQFAAGELAASILGGNDFRLTQNVVAKGLAADAGGGAMALKEPGMALFEADLKSDQSIDAAKNALFDTVENVAQHPFTDAELERAKDIYLRSFQNTVNDPDRIGQALVESIALGDWRLFFLRRDQIKAATLADVNQFAAAYFQQSNRTTGIFIPTADPKRAPAPRFVDVEAELKNFKGSAAPEAGEAFDVSPENINRRTEIGTLPGALHYALLPKKTRGGKVVALVSLHFGDEKSLLGTVTSGTSVPSLLPRGTTTMTREQLAAAFEKLQTSWNITGSEEGITLSLDTTRENLIPALTLATDVLRHPRFDPAEFKQMQDAWIAGVESERTDPSALLSEKIERQGNPYPPGDVRYAMTIDENLAAIRALTVDQARDFYQRFYGATDATLVAVGDFDSNQLKGQFEQDFGDWKSPQPWTRVPRPYVDVPGTSFTVQVDDKQNAVMLGELDVPLRETDREYWALSLATRIFGGDEASRLWDRIRQKGGLSYGVGTYLSGGQFNANATWAVDAIFAPQNTDKVKAAFYDELERARRDGFTADELKHAKQSIDEEVLLGRAQDGRLAGGLSFLVQRDQTPLYFKQIRDLRDSITLDEANAAFRKYIVADRLVLGFGGDFKAKPPK